MPPTMLPTVLLIDDEQDVLDAVQRDLRAEFNCVTAIDVESGLAQMKNGLQPFAVIVDEKLGPKSGAGLDLLKIFRQKYPMIVRCLFSGRVDLTSIAIGLNEGVFHRFFAKPWSDEKLRMYLQECVVLHQVLQESRKDELTGLLNRRGLEEQIHIEYERAVRHGRPLSLVLFDIDYFKKINDEKGHHAGDVILKKLSFRLIQSFRNIDYTGRWGGDEFVVLLPDTSEAEALVVAERVHERIKDEIPISIGVACIQNDSSQENDLFKKADEALYRAKAKGRNQVQT